MGAPLYVLVATIPERRASCERLLANLPAQSRHPDVVNLVLDGYGNAPLPLRAKADWIVGMWRTERRRGPGGRWRVVREFPPEATVVVLDDDVSIALAPRLVESLAEAVEKGSAAACFGICLDGRRAVGPSPMGDLACMGAATMAFHAGDLDGLDAFADSVRLRSDFDPLGDLGDDEALVSAHLWQRGVRLVHVPVAGVREAEDAQMVSQTRRRLATKAPFFRQREAIARITGWPWPNVAWES